METMRNDCPETFQATLGLPQTITGLNIWPPKDPNVTTKDIYEPFNPIDFNEVNDETNTQPKIHGILCASNRGPRKGNFVVNPQWTSEEKNQPPTTVRQIGRVYEPSPTDFFGARDLHAKTWQQARVYPGHGPNPNQAIPGYAPYKHVPVSYRTGKEEIGNSWPWNQDQALLDWQQQPDGATRPSTGAIRRPRTANGTYFIDTPDQESRFDQELNALHDTHVADRMNGGKPDIETREFTRSNREITYGFDRSSLLAKNPYTDTHVSLPYPNVSGGHPELTDMFATTYSRNLPQMRFRKAQHAHAPWHAYMTFCDWGEPQMQVPHPLA